MRTTPSILEPVLLRQRQQPRLLVGEDLGDGAIVLLGMAPLMRHLVAPAAKLRVEIVDIDKRARGKERVPHVLDLALDFPLLIAAAGRAGARRKVIMAGQLQQARMKTDGGAGAFEHGTPEVVVDQGPGHALEGHEAVDVPAEKTFTVNVTGSAVNTLFTPTENKRWTPAAPKEPAAAPQQ